MNREIKFRAWRNDLKMMVRVINGIDFDLNEMDCEKDKVLSYDSAFEWNGSVYEVMQFTGLKDKNEKEIYEGDLLQQTPPKNDPLNELYPKLLIVEWHLKGFRLEPVDVDTLERWRIITNWADMEIIGNIYENPELLK